MPIFTLLRILARAHHVQARMMQNPTLSVHDIAQEEHVSAGHCHIAEKKNTRILRHEHCQATATASRHTFIASARKTRCVLAEMR
jgi:hypothetical protein